LVEAVLEDGFDAGIAKALDGNGTAAGGFEALGAVGFLQA
jgi:hypothetical protein